MKQDRRTVLKNLLIFAGGVSLIPSCMQKKDGSASIQLKSIKIDAEEEKLLAELAETIIPRTETPGAKDTYTHLYILKMVDDCRTKEEQKVFTKGFKAFEKYTKDQSQQSFVQLNQQQREQILQQIQDDPKVPEDVRAFYNLVKGMTLQGYLSSKFYLTKVQVYELAPGRFKGCIPVERIQKEHNQDKRQV